MIHTSHVCDNNPNRLDDEKVYWATGSLAQCSHHKHNRNMPRVRGTGKQNRKEDKQAGKLGTDRGGFISGTE